MLKRLMLLTVAVAMLAAVPASALDFEQKAWYGQGVLALPMGNFGDFAKIGVGGGLGLSVPHSPELTFRGEVSYIYFTTEDIPNADVSASLIPILALAQYNMDSSSAYLLGGLGFAIAKLSVDYTETVPGFGTFSAGGSDSSTEFGLVVGAGFNLSPTMTLEGRFNVISDANSLSANLGWWF